MIATSLNTVFAVRSNGFTQMPSTLHKYAERYSHRHEEKLNAHR